MRVKKYNGRVYGADLTAAERKAMNIEINRQILEKDEQYAADMDALVLWVLMEHYGWRKKRLRRFWDAFIEQHKKLREYYQMDQPGDAEWFAHYRLKQIGVDIKEWYKEEMQNETQR